MESFPASGVLPRVSTKEKDGKDIGDIGAIPTITVQRGDVEGLPTPVDGTFFIVSGLVFSATDRIDVIAPDTGPTCIRENGHITAVTRFIRK